MNIPEPLGAPVGAGFPDGLRALTVFQIEGKKGTGEIKFYGDSVILSFPLTRIGNRLTSVATSGWFGEYSYVAIYCD